MHQGGIVDHADVLAATPLDGDETRLMTVAEKTLPATVCVQNFAVNAAYKLNRAVLDEAAEGIYGLNERGFTTFVNPAAFHMTGWTEKDLKGRTQHSMVHHSRHDGSAYPVEECPIYKTLHEGVVQQRDDEVFWRKDGTCFPVAYISTPVLRHGKPYGAVVVFCDITLRVHEEAWQESKARIFSSLRQRAPMLETAARIAEAFSVFVGSQRAQRGHGIVRFPHGFAASEADESVRG